MIVKNNKLQKIPQNKSNFPEKDMIKQENTTQNHQNFPKLESNIFINNLTNSPKHSIKKSINLTSKHGLEYLKPFPERKLNLMRFNSNIPTSTKLYNFPTNEYSSNSNSGLNLNLINQNSFSPKYIQNNSNNLIKDVSINFDNNLEIPNILLTKQPTTAPANNNSYKNKIASLKSLKVSNSSL